MGRRNKTAAKNWFVDHYVLATTSLIICAVDQLYLGKDNDNLPCGIKRCLIENPKALQMLIRKYMEPALNILWHLYGLDNIVLI